MAKTIQRKRTIGLTGYHLTADELKLIMKALDVCILAEKRAKMKKTRQVFTPLSDIPKDIKKLRKIIGVTVWY